MDYITTYRRADKAGTSGDEDTHKSMPFYGVYSTTGVAGDASEDG